MKHIVLVVAMAIATLSVVQGQNHDHSGMVFGMVYEKINDSTLFPIPGVTVAWKGTDKFTFSMNNGHYMIDTIRGSHMLEFSSIGYKSKVIQIKEPGKRVVYLEQDQTELKEAQVKVKRSSSSHLIHSTENTIKINEEEFEKAACCNVSESFETTPSVDVTISDAATGNRDIQMLGLAGRYAQINIENIPYARGLIASRGLSFIPATWVKSIYINQRNWLRGQWF